MSFPLLEKMLSGDRLALARLISQVEGRRELIPLMARVEENCGKAVVIGVTGPPGAGKSTLVDRMITHARREGKRVGVVAIDPSSPFSGGAVLGDRIRMQEHAGDDGVFIRSLGSRGSHGGLSRAAREVVKLCDAFGMDWIFVETVGVGQTELDIMEIADTTVVLLTPESGDAIQTLKAGILEIADIFAVNKADREGADRMTAELKAMLDFNPAAPATLAAPAALAAPVAAERRDWKIPVLPVQATTGVGIEPLMAAVEDHQAYLRSLGRRKRRGPIAQEVREIVAEELIKKIKVSDLAGGNPYKKAGEILRRFSWQGSRASTRRRPRSLGRSRRPARRRSGRR